MNTLQIGRDSYQLLVTATTRLSSNLEHYLDIMSATLSLPGHCLSHHVNIELIVNCYFCSGAVISQTGPLSLISPPPSFFSSLISVHFL